MPVRNVCKLLDVRNAACRIGNGFSEERLRVWTESLFDFFFACVRIDECTFDAELFHGDGEKVVSAAVDCGGADEMIARFADVEDGEEVGGLSGTCEHSGDSAFEFRYLLGDGVVGRVLEARVEIAFRLEVEQVRHLGARVVFESRALVNRKNSRFAFFG